MLSLVVKTQSLCLGFRGAKLLINLVSRTVANIHLTNFMYIFLKCTTERGKTQSGGTADRQASRICYHTQGDSPVRKAAFAS